MRDFESRKAEILRRSEARISARKKRNKQIITMSLSLCFVLVISFALLPKLKNVVSNDSYAAEGGAPSYGIYTETSNTADSTVNGTTSIETDFKASLPTGGVSEDDFQDTSAENGFVEEEVSQDEASEEDENIAEEAFLFAKLKYKGLDYYLTDEKEFNKLSKILNEILKNGEINEPADEGQLPEDETNDSITITVYEKWSEREETYVINNGRLLKNNKVYKVDNEALNQINQIFFVEK